jgi:hypothetical protein
MYMQSEYVVKTYYVIKAEDDDDDDDDEDKDDKDDDDDEDEAELGLVFYPHVIAHEAQ